MRLKLIVLLIFGIFLFDDLHSYSYFSIYFIATKQIKDPIKTYNNLSDPCIIRNIIRENKGKSEIYAIYNKITCKFI